jgi:predicted site-specific integrase-resolvase
MNVLPKERAEKILAWLRRGGVSIRQIARELDVNRNTVLRYKKRASLDPIHYRSPRVIFRRPKIVVSLETMERFEDVAILRGTSRDDLITAVLTVVATDDLFDAVLG